MPRITQETEIPFSDRKVRVEVTQLPGRRSVLLLARLGRILGPGLAGVAGKAAGPEAMAPLIGAVLERLTDSEFDALSKELLEGARIMTEGGWAPVLPALNGREFVGEPAAILAILAFALGVNYSSFSHGLGGIVEAWKAGAARST